MTIWWIVMAIGASALIVYARKGQNAVWGTAVIGLLIGLGLAIYQPGFDWWLIAKSVAVAALIGLVLEGLPFLGSRRH